MASIVPQPDHEKDMPGGDEEGDEAAAMAAFMGFSAFGTQGVSKKRKYNPQTDALIDGQDLESIDRGGKRGKGSGGNQIPLGKSRVLGSGQGATGVEVQGGNSEEMRNPDEIDLGLDDQDMGKGQDMTGVVPQEAVQTFKEKNLTSPRRAELNEVQRQIDAVTTRTSYVGDQQANPETTAISLPNPLANSFSNGPASLPPTPAFSNTSNSPNYQRTPWQNGNAGRGQRNDIWYVGYFDPSFLENPWKKLEVERGWPARGSWMESTTGGR